MAAAKAMAQRVLGESPKEAAGRIERVFKLVLSRPPDAHELAWVSDFYDRQVTRLQSGEANPEVILAAEEADSRAELAAWTLVCRAILNSDEAIVRG
jgi:hypothetical protein